MTSLLFPYDVRAGAEFSMDRKYRFRLWRHWGADSAPKRVAVFCMLNPSVANEVDLDPTLRRCRSFAMNEWNCTGMVVVNLFAVVLPYPEVLRTIPDPVGDTPMLTTMNRTVTNTAVILEEARSSDVLMVGWGAFPEAKERAAEVAKKLVDAGVTPKCLGVTSQGAPRHPLYIAGGTALQPYEVSR